MEAKNLRIGNFIASSGNPKNIETWVIGKVHSISSMDSEFEQIEVETEEEFTWFFKDNYFGIPLTEKWLIDFGFSGQPCDYAKDKLSVCLKDSDSFHKEGRTYYNYWAILEKQPKYVHELQNLFFAITGTELELKADV